MNNKSKNLYQNGVFREVPYRVFYDHSVRWEDVIGQSTPGALTAMLFKVQNGNWDIASGCTPGNIAFWHQQILTAATQKFPQLITNLKNNLPPPEWRKLLKANRGDEKAAVAVHLSEILNNNFFAGAQQIFKMAEIGYHHEQFGGLDAQEPYSMCCFSSDGGKWTPGAKKEFADLIIPVKAWARQLCFRVETPLASGGGFLDIDPYDTATAHSLNKFVQKEINQLFDKTEKPYAVTVWRARLMPAKHRIAKIQFLKKTPITLYMKFPEQRQQVLDAFEGNGHFCNSTSANVPEL